MGRLFEDMNILILGNGEEEKSWAYWALDRSEHRVVGAFPGFTGGDFRLSGLPSIPDLDTGLAIPSVDLVIVGGAPDLRMEALRRVASLGLPAICLHPPGPDSEAYYQVSLSRMETGAIIVPDLPLRLHPGLVRLKETLESGTIGEIESLRFEIPIQPLDHDLAREVFPKFIDAVRAVAGEPVSVRADGTPRGDTPRSGLRVSLDLAGGCPADISFLQPYSDRRRLYLSCKRGILYFEYNPNSLWPARLSIIPSGGPEQTEEFHDWNPCDEIFSVLTRSLESEAVPGHFLPNPNLDDGIRAMEITEAVVRSLRRERKIDLHYQAISEEANFKSVMTSTGCLVLLGILFVLPVSLAGPAIGLPWLIYLSYLIPISLGLFAVLQVLRLAVRSSTNEVQSTATPDVPSPD